MDIYLIDWANLLLRWLHVITAIAWIGASFYFVWLDNSLEPPASQDDRGARASSGELWAVHGGGFYNPQKYQVAPQFMPQKLHWFYWEAYSTWLSGFGLLTVLYLFNASAFLIDKSLFDWSPAAAIAGSLVYLAAGWVFYDLICRVFGARAGRRPAGRHPGRRLRRARHLDRLPAVRRPRGLRPHRARCSPPS